MNDLPMYLNTLQTAAILGLSARTLDRYRINGEGPPYYKFGQRVRYARNDVDDWARACRRYCTSDDDDGNGNGNGNGNG